jgi:hypothetical protein
MYQVFGITPKQLKYEPQVFFIKETFGLVFER